MQVKGRVRQHAYRDDTAAAIRLSAVRRSDGTALARDHPRAPRRGARTIHHLRTSVPAPVVLTDQARGET